MHDTDQIAALMHIHEKASAHGTALEHIKNMAWAKLKKINDEHAPKDELPPAPVVAPEPEPEAESVADRIQNMGTRHG